MLTYVFDDPDAPLYEQVYQHIKEDITTGKLQPGEKLPSKRSFAGNHGISTITIQNAYDQLISEGYIYTQPRKGYYVADITGLTKPVKEHSISLGIKLPQPAGQYPVDLSSNKINPDNFPFSVWAKTSREVISKMGRELMEISPSCGVLKFRKAIAEHLRSFRGMLVDPDQIIIGAGTEYLYGLLIQLFGTDKLYCIENPGYQKLMRIYQQHGIDCRAVDIDDQGISADELRRSGAAIAHISPNHHFPTGTTMPASRRYEVLAWAAESEDRYIIEDDYDSEFRTNGKPLPTLFSIDAFEKVIYMNTFSKSLSPTIRISYMVLPVHLINRYYEQLSFYSCTVSNFEQYTLAAFIQKGYFEKHINRMRLYYRRQRAKVIESIEVSRLNNICEILENDSGLHFLIKLDTELSDREVTSRLRKKGIQMQALSEFYFKASGAAASCHERDEKTSSSSIAELFFKNPGKGHCFIINYSNISSCDFTDNFETVYETVHDKPLPDGKRTEKLPKAVCRGGSTL